MELQSQLLFSGSGGTVTHAHAPWPSVAINTDSCGSTGGHYEGEWGREEEGKMRDRGGTKKKIRAMSRRDSSGWLSEVWRVN